MNPAKPTVPFRTIDAMASAVTVGPTLIRDSRVFGGVCVCVWDTPWLEGFELPESDELILAYHDRGSHDVRRMNPNGASRTRSIPGLLTLIPPGRSVAYHTGGPVSFTTIHISNAALEVFFQGGHEFSNQDRFAFRDPFVVSCVNSLLREARVPDRWSPRFVSAVTEALVLHLVRQTPAARSSEPDSSVQKIADARMHIEAELGGNLSLARLAAHADLSRAHFARVFREVVNEPPHRYVMRRRLERAAELLAESGLGLKEIAQDTGFCSQAHLTQLFRARTGLTPQQYRRKHHSIAH